MRESWESQWKSWFVTTDSVEDQRKPGKLKSKSYDLYDMGSNLIFQRNSAFHLVSLLDYLQNVILPTIKRIPVSNLVPKVFPLAVSWSFQCI